VLRDLVELLDEAVATAANTAGGGPVPIVTNVSMRETTSLGA
jgi:hypothetical protein